MASEIQYIHGQHRSLELAERHLRSLARQFPDSQVSIVARRNAHGKFSSRGQFFTFKIETEEEEEFEEIELVGGFDSPGRKKK